MVPLTILGIDPGTKEMGLAVIRGPQLIAFGVRTIRGRTGPSDLIGQARRVVLLSIEEHNPDLVAIEAPLLVPTKRAALLSVITQELHARARQLGLAVRELSPAQIRQAVVGNPKATKLDVARALVAHGFAELGPKLPTPPARAALGFRPKDKYWLHMFDALALAVAVRDFRRTMAAPGIHSLSSREGVHPPTRPRVPALR